MTELATRAAPTPSRVGQATAVEQSRAVAEVQAAIVVARQFPRDQTGAQAMMRESCKLMGLAERAFFSYPKGGATLSGPSVHLARELARCWGNVQYGITELERDDDRGESQMLAEAWDVQTNTRVRNTFIVPHKRDKKAKGGNREPEKLVDLRDIYENNANMGARRLREAIFAILPPWYTEEAKGLCHDTLARGDGQKPLAQRIADTVAAFDGNGITRGQLEGKIGRKTAAWTVQDVVRLGVVWTSLSRGETTPDEEFPPSPVTAADITRQAEAAKAGEPSPSETPATTDKADRKALNRLFALLGELGYPADDRDARLAMASSLLRKPIGTFNDLSPHEAGELASVLQGCVDSEDPQGRLNDLLDAATPAQGEQP